MLCGRHRFMSTRHYCRRVAHRTNGTANLEQELRKPEHYSRSEMLILKQNKNSYGFVLATLEPSDDVSSDDRFLEGAKIRPQHLENCRGKKAAWTLLLKKLRSPESSANWMLTIELLDVLFVARSQRKGKRSDDCFTISTRWDVCWRCFMAGGSSCHCSREAILRGGM